MAYANVQSVFCTAFPQSVTSTGVGNGLIVFIGWDDSANTNPTLTGWTAIGTKVNDIFNYAMQPWYIENGAGALTSVAIASWSAGTPGELKGWFAEYSGLASSSSLIVSARQAQAGPGTGTDAITSGNANVTDQPALIVGCSVDMLSQTTMNPGTGYTGRAGSAGYGTRIEDKRVTSTGNQAATYTGGASPLGCLTWVVAFKEAVAAAAGTPNLLLMGVG